MLMFCAKRCFFVCICVVDRPAELLSSISSAPLHLWAASRYLDVHKHSLLLHCKHTWPWGAALHSPCWLPCSCTRLREQPSRRRPEVHWRCLRSWRWLELLGTVSSSAAWVTTDCGALEFWWAGGGRHVSGLKQCRVTDSSSHSGREEHEIWAVAD